MAHPYLMLKVAGELYAKPPEQLADEERSRVDRIAARRQQIERRVLATAEAAQVALPDALIERDVAEIRGRYASEREFMEDLERAGLDADALWASVARDLKIHAVLERVASEAPVVSDTEVEIFYLMHRERFARPESRSLRHVLTTINENLPGSEREAARRKIDAIRARLVNGPERFAEEARRHSECPTAMNGGMLGTVRRGQLFAELEPTAFALAVGELSAVVESPLGFHLIHCIAAEAACESPLAAVHAKVRAHIEASRRRAYQAAWLRTRERPESP